MVFPGGSENPPATQESQIQSLGQKDCPGEGNGYTHSSILAWEIPWTEAPGGLQSIRSLRVGHSWIANTHPGTCAHVLSADSENSLKKDPPWSLHVQKAPSQQSTASPFRKLSSLSFLTMSKHQGLWDFSVESETTAKNNLNRWT